MNEIHLSNIPQMSVGHTVKSLGEAYCAVINAGLCVNTLPSVMMWGPPGVGKSQGVRQLGEIIEKNTGKKCFVTDVRLMLFNPIDLRGIPVANAEKTLAVWLKPKIFDMSTDDGVINILFLDEISAAPQSVQAAAYQITLDRVIGEHRLPDNCIVIAAGNRITDRSVAYRMPKALANRMMHIEITGEFDSWKIWAVKNGINPKVIGFLSFRRDFLVAKSNEEDLAFATPRTWELVSNLLNNVCDDVDKMHSLISGLVGTGVAVEFATWCRVYSNLPDIQAIFEGDCFEVPKSTDALYALVSSMVAYACQNKDDMPAIANSIEYAEKLPPDFSVVLLRDYMYIQDGYKQKLMKLPQFEKWLNSKGRLLNGNI